VTGSGALDGLRVMVVEDEMLVSLLIEDMLADQGCIVVGPFSEVKLAQAAARSEALDLAVLDVNVKGMRTYPVAEELDRRGVPFVFLSGYGETAIPADRPNWKVCSKPLNERELVSMLVQRRAAQRRG
jgi:CheY-like chemotaxis protein